MRASHHRCQLVATDLITLRCHDPRCDRRVLLMDPARRAAVLRDLAARGLLARGAVPAHSDAVGETPTGQ
jgi:hypothetical protein